MKAKEIADKLNKFDNISRDATQFITEAGCRVQIAPHVEYQTDLNVLLILQVSENPFWYVQTPLSPKDVSKLKKMIDQVNEILNYNVVM